MYPTADLSTWCNSILGPCQIVSNQSRDHPDDRTASWRLRTERGDCFLKVHREAAAWESEVHGYEQWSPIFGEFAPRLLAVHEEEPRALLLSALPGQILEQIQLAVDQERDVWRAAGKVLADLHALIVGDFFGPCRRDGSPVSNSIFDAEAYVTAELAAWTARGQAGGYLRAEELAILDAVRALIPAFAGERPLPCHRDYGPANWLVTEDGAWAGVIDFEFAHWDLRIADFTRYPDWQWIHRPDLIDAFFEGYGRSFTPDEEAQRIVGHVQYALSAIVWGEEHAYHGFADEGRQALQWLAQRWRLEIGCREEDLKSPDRLISRSQRLRIKRF